MNTVTFTILAIGYIVGFWGTFEYLTAALQPKDGAAHFVRLACSLGFPGFWLAAILWAIADARKRRAAP